MKKTFKLLTIMLAVFVVFASKAHATDLTDKITANDGLGGLSTFTKTYDAENDVNNLKVSLVVNEESINSILSQKPGVGGKLSTFYLGISPNTGNTPVYKENYYYYHTDTKTVDEIKEAVNARIGEDDLSSNETVWIIGVGIQYYDSVNNKWVSSGTNGDGVTSCREDLMNQLGLTDESELKYGVNFRFFMYNNLDWWMVWSDKNPNTDTPTKVEYIKVSYEILFPIKSTNGTESVFHATLKDALERGYDEITINEDITLSEDLTLPDGKSLTVGEGATLTVPAGVSLVIEDGAILSIDEDAILELEDESVLDGEGTIEKNGKIVVEGTELFFVGIADLENGVVTVDNEVSFAGDVITISVAPSEGYELDTLKVVDADGNEVIVTNDKFTLTSDVEISATFKKIPTEVEVLPPQTSDINLPLILSMILVAVVGTVFALRKRFAKSN